MQKSKPFARAIAMIHALSGFLGSGMSMIQALAKVGHYESRGKGKGRTTYARGNNRNHHNPIAYGPNGPRPVARRKRQAERAPAAPERHCLMLDRLRSNENMRAF